MADPRHDCTDEISRYSCPACVAGGFGREVQAAAHRNELEQLRYRLTLAEQERDELRLDLVRQESLGHGYTSDLAEALDRQTLAERERDNIRLILDTYESTDQAKEYAAIVAKLEAAEERAEKAENESSDYRAWCLNVAWQNGWTATPEDADAEDAATFIDEKLRSLGLTVQP